MSYSGTPLPKSGRCNGQSMLIHEYCVSCTHTLSLSLSLSLTLSLSLSLSLSVILCAVRACTTDPDHNAFSIIDVASKHNLLIRLIPLLGSSHPLQPHHMRILHDAALQDQTQQTVEADAAILQAMLRTAGDEFYAGPFHLSGVHVACLALLDVQRNILVRVADWPAGAVCDGVVNTDLDQASLRFIAVLLYNSQSLLSLPRHQPTGHAVLSAMSLKAQGCYVVPVS